MTAQAGSAHGGGGARLDEAAKQKERRQKAILIATGVILVLLLAIEGPKTLKSLSGSSTHGAPPATPVTLQPSASTAPATPTATSDQGELKRGLRRLPAKDPFLSQVAAASTSAPAATAPPVNRLSAGPDVRATHFSSKDPFVSQIVSVTPATTVAAPPSASKTQASKSTDGAVSGYGFVVVLATPSAAHGWEPATRAVVAAQNAGLKDINVLGSRKPPKAVGSAFTVYAGPYATRAEADNELMRALRVGYVGAYTRSYSKLTRSHKAQGL